MGSWYNNIVEWENIYMLEDVNLFIYSYKVKKYIYCRDGNFVFL